MAAGALLMPIRWPEPFGLVMTEAMACGTPVIAFPEGSASELVLDGEGTGFVVEDEQAMAEAIGRLGEIDPERCRESARERFDVTAVAEKEYEKAYEGRDLVQFTHALTRLPPGGTLTDPWRTSTAPAAG